MKEWEAEVQDSLVLLNFQMLDDEELFRWLFVK